MKTILAILFCLFVLAGCGSTKYLIDYNRCNPVGNEHGICDEKGVHKIK